jgi:diamine N-acetyltransferase
MALPQDLLRNGPTRLRTLEPEDVDWMMRWENAPEHWQVSGTIAPYSRAALEALCQGHQDLYTAGQLRWVVEERGKPIGAVDLYEFSALHQRSGIGILIDPDHRGKGSAGRALAIAVEHAESVLLLRGLHAQVHAHNGPSCQLFLSNGFDEVGRFKDWTRTQEGWHDAVLFQRTFNTDDA